MRWSLLIFNVWFSWPIDSSVCQLLRLNVVLAVVHLSAALPVPVQSPHVFKSSNLLISQVGDDLEHFASVAVVAEHFPLQDGSLLDELSLDEPSEGEGSNNPFCILGVLDKNLFHFS